MYTYEKGSVQLLKRNAAGNKGTFGKALLVAGSNGMAGAAILAAKAAYRTGAGMVKVISGLSGLVSVTSSDVHPVNSQPAFVPT